MIYTTKRIPALRLSYLKWNDQLAVCLFIKLNTLQLWSLLTTYRKLCNWAFQRTHYWIPIIQDGWDPKSLIQLHGFRHDFLSRRRIHCRLKKQVYRRRMEFLHPAMWQVDLGGHAIEFARWQGPAMWQVALGWHDIEFTQSSKRPPYWNSTFGFDFGHITAVDMPFCAIISKSDHPREKKNDVMSIFKMADLRHLGF